MLDDFLELFTDPRNEATILVHHQQAQIILVKEGYRSLFGVNGHGRHGSNAHPSRRLSHRRKHLKRMGAQRDKVNRFGHVVRGEDRCAMRKDTGLDAWKTSAELDHAIDREHLLCHEDRLERILIDNLNLGGGSVRTLGFNKHCFRNSAAQSPSRAAEGAFCRLPRRFGEESEGALGADGARVSITGRRGATGGFT